MLKDTKKLANSRLLLTITVNAEQFRHAFDSETEEAGKDLKIEGFRPGKAPANKVIEKIGRQRIEVAALDHSISEVYQHVMVENKIIPVEGPKVEIKSFVAPSDDASDDTEVVKFTAEVDVLPEVQIKGYEKIKIKQPKEKVVEQADVDKVLDELRRQRASLVEAAKDAKAKKGMWLDIYFSGSVDGVAREDMKSEHHPLILGEGNLIPGFEDELIGMVVGEEKTFPITFPKDYHAAALKGKKAVFSVKVHELKEVVLPVLDNDFAKMYGQKSIEAMQDTVRDNLKQEKEEERKREIEELVLNELIHVAKFDLPQALVNQEQDRVFDETKERFSRMQIAWEDYVAQVGKSEDELKKEVREQAEKNVRIGLALGKVIQETGIKGADGQAMREAVDKLIEIATRK